MRAKVVSLALDHCESVSVATTTWHGIIKLLADGHAAVIMMQSCM